MGPILNAFLDDDGGHVVLRELADGEVRERRVPAAYTTYHREEDLDPALMRSLKGSDHVAHVAQEPGGWVRVGWRNDQLRRSARYQFKEIGVECFEGDVDPVMFWLVSSAAKIARPRRRYLDFETDSRVPLSRKQDMRVLSWALTDEEGKTSLEILEDDHDEAEAELLGELVRQLGSCDQILTWEGDWKGGEFDSFIFEARTRRLGLGVDARRWIWLNQLAVWRKMNSAESGAEKESFKLEDIAFEQIGEGKELVPEWVVERFGERARRGLGALAWELWAEGGKFRELLGTYNKRDAEILQKLEARKGYVQLFQAICEVCGVPPVTRSLQTTRRMDGFLLRLGREHQHRFPTKAFKEEDEEEEEKGKFKGAVVFFPKSVPCEDKGWTAEDAANWRRAHGFKNGILHDVHVCDFKSLYPSVMRTWNLSADAVVGWQTEREFREKGAPEGQCRSPGTGLLTRKSPEGFLPLAFRVLMDFRAKYAKEADALPPGTPEWMDAKGKSDACKVTANSFYGGGGSRFSRYNDRDVSEACTQNGVHFLKLTAEEGERRKMVLVYGDTDSNMVIGPTEDGFRKFVRWLNVKRIPDEVAKYGCAENFVELAFEKSFERIVFVSSKAYIGRYSQYKGSRAKRECHGKEFKHEERCEVCGGHGVLAGEPEIKGVAYKRGDKGKLARELQGRIIDLLVGGLKVKDAAGKKVSPNAGLRIVGEGDEARVAEGAEGRPIVGPTLDLDAFRAVLHAARNHVLAEPLAIEEVRFSKGISKPLKQYIKRNADGSTSVPAHVVAGQALEARGQKIGAGSKIEYVVVDGASSPQKVIPAEDFAGDCDRYYLWERVYSPTKSLLEAAFPDEDWEKWGDVRPPKPRGRAAKVPEEQLGLALGAASTRVDADEIALPVYNARPLVVEIPEEAGEEALLRLRKVFARHPGARAVELVIVTKSGARAVMACPLRVSTGPALKEAVDRAISGEGEAA